MSRLDPFLEGRCSSSSTPGDWTFWFIKSGRGFGKTRTAAEWVRSEVDNCPRWLFVGPTPRDVRDLMIEGESGIQNVFPRHQRPKYEPAKLKLTFHNGATAMVHSAFDYESLRGPQFGGFWAEVVATGPESRPSGRPKCPRRRRRQYRHPAACRRSELGRRRR